MLAKVSPRVNSLVSFVSELLMLQQQAESSKNVNGFINNQTVRQGFLRGAGRANYIQTDGQLQGHVVGRFSCRPSAGIDKLL